MKKPKKPIKKRIAATGEPVFGIRSRARYTGEVGELCRKSPGKWIGVKWSPGSGRSIISNARLLSGLPFEGRVDVEGNFWVRLEG
jgi:hypothetical protein